MEVRIIETQGGQLPWGKHGVEFRTVRAEIDGRRYIFQANADGSNVRNIRSIRNDISGTRTTKLSKNNAAKYTSALEAALKAHLTNGVLVITSDERTGGSLGVHQNRGGRLA